MCTGVVVDGIGPMIDETDSSVRVSRSSITSTPVAHGEVPYAPRRIGDSTLFAMRQPTDTQNPGRRIALFSHIGATPLMQIQ